MKQGRPVVELHCFLFFKVLWITRLNEFFKKVRFNQIKVRHDRLVFKIWLRSVNDSK